MLFYDCIILCFDVDFNRQTAGEGASYFESVGDLQRYLDGPMPNDADRQSLRKKYTTEFIVNEYLKFFEI